MAERFWGKALWKQKDTRSHCRCIDSEARRKGASLWHSEAAKLLHYKQRRRRRRTTYFQSQHAHMRNGDRCKGNRTKSRSSGRYIDIFSRHRFLNERCRQTCKREWVPAVLAARRGHVMFTSNGQMNTSYYTCRIIHLTEHALVRSDQFCDPNWVERWLWMRYHFSQRQTCIWRYIFVALTKSKALY